MMFNCMERRGFILDPTQPDAHKFWFELFDKYASMGYKYFKLDFLAPMTTIPQAKDKTIPRGRYIPDLFATVNQAVNGRAELMACGYPYLCGNPGAEAIRVGQDIHAKWDCIKANASDIVSLYPFNGKRWLNDPDFALCRGVETSDDPALNQLRPCLVYNKKEGNNPAFYQEYSLGLGEEKNGLLLLLSMDDRDYSLVTYGDFGNYAFNDEGRPLLADFFLDDFGSDDWYTGFSDYLDWSEKYLIAAGNGEPYTNDHSPDGGGSILLKFVVIFLFPLLVAFIYVGTLKAKMKTVAKATEAATYMTSEMNLTEANDRYTHTTETRRTISSDKSNSSNSSSGGFSGTSGKF
jgi:hypothetical protein